MATTYQIPVPKQPREPELTRDQRLRIQTLFFDANYTRDEICLYEGEALQHACKEYIDGEVHYMVDWVPTLVRGHVLRKAQAQPLISSFEARCQSYTEEGKGQRG